MVLVVNGVLQEDIPTDSRSLYAAHPVYRETAAQLHSMPAKLVGPMGLLYVQQREMAATLPHDSKYLYGSSRLTCPSSFDLASDNLPTLCLQFLVSFFRKREHHRLGRYDYLHNRRGEAFR